MAAAAAAATSSSCRWNPVCKVVDSVLLVFFYFMAVVAPLVDGQTVIPIWVYPQILVDLKKWYVKDYGDYLIMEKPNFFLGAVWLELLFQWPLSIANVYGILGGKSWYKTTCLMYGVSTFSAMAAILAEVIGSGRASNKLVAMYLPFLGISFVAMLRGLIASLSSSNHVTATKTKAA